ncbi:hypothetical protein LCGC14_2341860 [marine sediment metagenome]|uniref:Uncharacterized protein n=1 Tax=marine sediment metagenome TaxID=412755 RepID=A0A0F9F6Y1_9ZZZZ
MPKESIQESAFNELDRRMGDALGLLDLDFKGVTPFGKEPKSMDEQLLEYEQVSQSPEQLMGRVERHGEAETNEWLGAMVKETQRRNNARERTV